MNQRYEKSVQHVGIDLHRRRSVVVRMDGEGEVVDCVRIDNSVPNLVAEVAKAGPGAEVAVEATYGWYWAVDALSQAGFAVTLAHPRGIVSMQNRRAKTDQLDAKELADLLRIGRLASAWIAPPGVRELRELVRYRHKLVHTRAGVKASVHAVLGKCGVIPEIADVFGPIGTKMLDALCCRSHMRPGWRRNGGSLRCRPPRSRWWRLRPRPGSRTTASTGPCCRSRGRAGPGGGLRRRGR